MQKLTDNAVRARELLTRENAPLPPACARVLTADLARVLGEYFSLTAPPEVSIERGTGASHHRPRQGGACKALRRAMKAGYFNFRYFEWVSNKNTIYCIFPSNCCKSDSFFYRAWYNK